MGKDKGKKKGKKSGKSSKKGKKASAKKKKEVVSEVIEVKHSKAVPDHDISPYTGTRYRPNTSQQKALEIVINGANKGKTVKEIKSELGAYRKENGKDANLDSGYFNFVVATHPEMFEVWNTGEIKLLKEPSPNKKAIAALEKEEEARKERAKKARKNKKSKGKSKKTKVGGKGKPTLKK